MRSNKTHHFLCFAFLRKFLWPVHEYIHEPVQKGHLEVGSSDGNGHEHIPCQALRWRFSSKTRPLISISPKSTNLWLPHFVSSELYTFSKVKYLSRQHSESNTEQLELYHNSTAEETCSLYNCKQSTHQKLLQKSRETKCNTLVTIKLWFLECFSPRS